MSVSEKELSKCAFCEMSPANNVYKIHNFLTSSVNSYTICDECKKATDHSKKDKTTPRERVRSTVRKEEDDK